MSLLLLTRNPDICKKMSMVPAKVPEIWPLKVGKNDVILCIIYFIKKQNWCTCCADRNGTSGAPRFALGATLWPRPFCLHATYYIFVDMRGSDMNKQSDAKHMHKHAYNDMIVLPSKLNDCQHGQDM